MKMTLGTRIAALRRAKKLKQEDLAEMLGVSAQAVSKWENDQSCPDIYLIPSLAKIFNVTTDELLTGEKPEDTTVRMLSESEKNNIKDMMLRFVVNTLAGDVIRLNFPISLIEMMISEGINISSISGNDALKSIDMNMILDSVKHGVIGNIMEVETADGDTIKVFVE